jgi:hypothetical protein
MLVIAPHSLAQAPITLESAQVELWPEYDRPEMLVILSGNLPADTQLPVTLTLRLPPASTLFAVALRDAQDGLVNTPYTTDLVDGASVVTMTLTRPNFHLEYYDGALVMDGNRRRFTFTWPDEWSTAAARVRVQEPAGASNLTVTPPLSAAGTGEFGLDYLAGDLGAIRAGQPVQVELTYDKTSTGLSADTNTGTAAPVPTAGSSLLPAPVVIGLAVLVGALVVGLWFWNQRRRPAPASARHSRVANRSSAPAARSGRPTPAPQVSAASPPKEDPAAAATTTPARFCTQCGQPLQAGDRFCRACGAAVRPAP